MRSVYIIRWPPKAANAALLLRCPVCALPTAGLRCFCRPFGVPDIFLADDAAASAIDPGTHLCSALSATGSAEQRGRGHSLGSLLPPPAALPSLPKFSLATSSLLTILEPFLTCVSYRKLLDKTLVYQGFSGFACCSLLYLAVGVLCRFFRARVGFVSVSTKDSDGTDIPFKRRCAVLVL